MASSSSQTASKALLNRFQNSFTFGPLFEECMEADRTLRANCWSHEVLILNCNTLIEKFIKTGAESMDRFFRQFALSKFSKKETGLNYVIIFFLSLEHFSPKCFEVEALRTILHKDYGRVIFDHWWKIRDTILLIFNKSGNTSAELNDYMLTKSETHVLIERVRNSPQVISEVEQWISAREGEIKTLRKEVRDGKQLSKPKLEKYEKNFKIGSGKNRSSPVALKLLDYFIEDIEVSFFNVRQREPKNQKLIQ